MFENLSASTVANVDPTPHHGQPLKRLTAICHRHLTEEAQSRIRNPKIVVAKKWMRPVRPKNCPLWIRQTPR
jgi:hypothetical protein